MRTVAYRLASVIAVWLFASPAAAGYSFSISASADNPDSVQSVPGGPRLLYLWLHCGDDGLSALEGALLTNLQVFGFTPAAGMVNAGSGTSLLLGLGACPEAPTVLGHWSVLDTGGHACLGPVVTAVDCASPNPAATLMPKVTGFSSTGQLPCEVGSNPCSAEGMGLVMGYGQVIEPPYEFSGEGSDTLRLNGHPYHPTRAAPTTPLEISPEVAAFTSAAEQVFGDAMAAAESVSDPSKRLDAAMAVYAASPMVAHVEATASGIAITWAAAPFEGIAELVHRDIFESPSTSGRSLRSGSQDEGDFHATLIQQFQTITGVDGYILFGGEYFTVGGNPGESAAMRRALRAIERGEPPSQLLKDTPLADNPILTDVLNASRPVIRP